MWLILPIFQFGKAGYFVLSGCVEYGELGRKEMDYIFEVFQFPKALRKVHEIISTSSWH